MHLFIMTSSNGNIFRVAGPLCGEFTGPGEFPTQRPVTRGFDVFFDLRLNIPLSKQSWGWWFETLSRSLWHHRNVVEYCTLLPYKDRLSMYREAYRPICISNVCLSDVLFQDSSKDPRNYRTILEWISLPRHYCPMVDQWMPWSIEHGLLVHRPLGDVVVISIVLSLDAC